MDDRADRPRHAFAPGFRTHLGPSDWCGFGALSDAHTGSANPAFCGQLVGDPVHTDLCTIAPHAFEPDIVVGNMRSWWCGTRSASGTACGRLADDPVHEGADRGVPMADATPTGHNPDPETGWIPGLDAIGTVLDMVWCAAVDATTSPDITTDEDRERYRRNVIAEARAVLLGS